MSYYEDDYRRFNEPPPRHGSWGISFALVVGGFVLLALLVMKLPELRKQWVESDPEFILKRREAEARGEAEVLYRKREAELKAEVDAAAAKLEKLQIEPSPLRAVVARAAPTVVNITASSRLRIEPPEIRRPRNQPHPLDRDVEIPRSEGSGVIVRIDDQKQGYIVTNSHVLQGSERVSVTLPSGRSIQVGSDSYYLDPLTDLAVIKFDASTLDHLAVAEFADSSEVAAGDWVVAIGSPFGLHQSVTFGIISAKGRVNHRIVDDVEQLIQTDVAINPGNSGGPLLNLKGQIVGINTAIVSRNGGFQGVGFAIPSNKAKEIFERLVEPPHKITRGFMGVRMNNLSEESASRLKLMGGVVIVAVEPTLPAAEAGLQRGDIVTRFGDKPVITMDQLRKLVMDTPPGTTVNLDVLRMEEDKPVDITVRVTVTERPPLEEGAARPPQPRE